MKKFFLIGLLPIFGIMKSQEQSIKVNPVGIIFGGSYDLVSYERKVSEHSTVGGGLGITSFTFDDSKYKGFGGSLFYRYYLKTALKGFYVSPHASFSGGNAKYDVYFANNGKYAGENKDQFTGFVLGAKAGYQWVFKGGFALDLNAGAAYTSFSYKADSRVLDVSSKKSNGVVPSLGLGLGYSF